MEQVSKTLAESELSEEEDGDVTENNEDTEGENDDEYYEEIRRNKKRNVAKSKKNAKEEDVKMAGAGSDDEDLPKPLRKHLKKYREVSD